MPLRRLRRREGRVRRRQWGGHSSGDPRGEGDGDGDEDGGLGEGVYEYGGWVRKGSVVRDVRWNVRR